MLAAYYGAAHDVEPPEGEPWTDDAGQPYADASGFSSAFLHHLERSVMRLAAVKGLPFGYAHGGVLPVDQNPFAGWSRERPVVGAAPHPAP